MVLTTFVSCGFLCLRYSLKLKMFSNSDSFFNLSAMLPLPHLSSKEPPESASAGCVPNVLCPVEAIGRMPKNCFLTCKEMRTKPLPLGPSSQLCALNHLRGGQSFQSEQFVLKECPAATAEGGSLLTAPPAPTWHGAQRALTLSPGRVCACNNHAIPGRFLFCT